MLLSSCMKYRAPCSHKGSCGEKGLVIILTVDILGWNCETVSQQKVVTQSKKLFSEARHVKYTPIKEIRLARLLTTDLQRYKDRKGYKLTYTNKRHMKDCKYWANIRGKWCQNLRRTGSIFLCCIIVLPITRMTLGRGLDVSNTSYSSMSSAVSDRSESLSMENWLMGGRRS